jgi:transposase-like protein
VWPETQTARRWCHKIANVLDKLPKRLQAQAKSRLHEVMYADTKEHANEAVVRFAEEYEAKYTKAVACLQQDQERLLVHFAPAEHWKHLRTTNIIESPFSTVRLDPGRRGRTPGAFVRHVRFLPILARGCG